MAAQGQMIKCGFMSCNTAHEACDDVTKDCIDCEIACKNNKDNCMRICRIYYDSHIATGSSSARNEASTATPTTELHTIAAAATPNTTPYTTATLHPASLAVIILIANLLVLLGLALIIYIYCYLRRRSRRRRERDRTEDAAPQASTTGRERDALTGTQEDATDDEAETASCLLSNNASIPQFHNPSLPSQNPSLPSHNPSLPSHNPSLLSQNSSLPSQNSSLPAHHPPTSDSETKMRSRVVQSLSYSDRTAAGRLLTRPSSSQPPNNSTLPPPQHTAKSQPNLSTSSHLPYDETDTPIKQLVTTHEADTPIKQLVTTHEADTPLKQRATTHEADTPIKQLLTTHEADTPIKQLVTTHEADTPIKQLVTTHEADTPIKQPMTTHEADTPIKQLATKHEADTPIKQLVASHDGGSGPSGQRDRGTQQQQEECSLGGYSRIMRIVVQPKEPEEAACHEEASMSTMDLGGEGNESMSSIPSSAGGFYRQQHVNSSHNARSSNHSDHEPQSHNSQPYTSASTVDLNKQEK